MRPLLLEAFEIASAKNTALEPEYAHEVHDQDYAEKRLTRSIQKMRVTKGMPTWLKKVELKFKELGLNHSQFVAEYNALKPPSMQVLHIGERFNFAMAVLKKTCDDKKYLASFLDPATHEKEFAEVTYEAGIVSYLGKSHPFVNHEYIALFNYLWPHRRVLRDGKPSQEGNPLAKAAVLRATKLSNERLRAMSNNVRKELYNKDIKVKLKMPDRVFLEITL